MAALALALSLSLSHSLTHVRLFLLKTVVYFFVFSQVFADFEVYGGALGLTSSCLYGGAPYQNQQIKLKRGVDIVIGTPGHIKVAIVVHHMNLQWLVCDIASFLLNLMNVTIVS